MRIMNEQVFRYSDSKDCPVLLGSVAFATLALWIASWIDGDLMGNSKVWCIC